MTDLTILLQRWSLRGRVSEWIFLFRLVECLISCMIVQITLDNKTTEFLKQTTLHTRDIY
jgi:hypothetical protein